MKTLKKEKRLKKGGKARKRAKRVGAAEGKQ